MIFLISTNTAFALSKTYKFVPGVPTEVPNPLFWTLDTHCHIKTDDQSDTLKGKMQKKSAILNGNKINEGQETELTVNNNDDLHIIADKNALVIITNYGKSTVTATCKI